MNNHVNPSRRDLLKGAGALVVSFSLARTGAGAAQRRRGARPLAPTEVDGFLAIDMRRPVTVYSGKVDLGTGRAHGARADRRRRARRAVQYRDRIIEGDTALTPDQGKTWGSLTIQAGGMQIRNAAATARTALLEQAAQAARRCGRRDLTVVGRRDLRRRPDGVTMAS